MGDTLKRIAPEVFGPHRLVTITPAQIARVGMTPEMLKQGELNAHIMSRMITVGITVSIGVLALAAGSTVFLVLASRRATLRQINASLLEISDQLKQLRK